MLARPGLIIDHSIQVMLYHKNVHIIQCEGVEVCLVWACLQSTRGEMEELPLVKTTIHQQQMFRCRPFTSTIATLAILAPLSHGGSVMQEYASLQTSEKHGFATENGRCRGRWPTTVEDGRPIYPRAKTCKGHFLS